MPRFRHILLAAIAFFGATPALAEQGNVWLDLHVGGSVPTGDLRRSVNDGLEGGWAATFFMSKRAAIGVDVAYQAWGGSLDGTPLESLLGSGWEVRLDAIQTTAHWLYNVRTGGRARPYAKAGCGPYWVKSSVRSPSGSMLRGERQPKFGYSVGAGFNLAAAPGFDAGASGMYHVIQDTGPDATFFTVAVNVVWGAGAK